MGSKIKEKELQAGDWMGRVQEECVCVCAYVCTHTPLRVYLQNVVKRKTHRKTLMATTTNSLSESIIFFPFFWL